jgi:negative regulator of sigma E activity
VLADLHAGALDAKQSAALWQQVNRDPEAQAVLAALDSVRRDLDDLGDAPAEPMPAHFAAQLDAALASEAARTRPARPGMAPVMDMAAARRRRNRRMGWAGGVLTAAAAAVAVAFVALPGGNETDGSPVAGATPDDNTSQVAPGDAPPVALSGDNLGPAISALQGQEDFGPMKDEQGLKDCLSGHGIEDPQIIGAREVTLDGAEGVAALLARGDGNARFRLVIVEPTCTEDDPGKLITNTSLG